MIASPTTRAYVVARLSVELLKLEIAREKLRENTMARVNLFGKTFTAEPVKDNGDGTYQMVAKEHSARATAGSTITVSKKEIVEMAAAEQPPDPKASADALESTMAAERKTLPSVDTLIAQAREAGTLPNQPAIPPGPPQRP